MTVFCFGSTCCYNQLLWNYFECKMIKWIIIISLIGIPIIFLSANSFQEKDINSGIELGKISMVEVAEEFARQTAFETELYEENLNELLEISEEDILKELQLPELEKNKNILNNGIELSANYNQVSLDYSSKRLTDQEYLSKLFDFRIKYEIYMTAIDSYIGDRDILILKNTTIQELKEINQQISFLKGSENIDESIEQSSGFDKYKKFLPSMFTP